MSPAPPLAGIRVVEAGRFASAPSCATLLAEWGADVVKLEPPDGDPARGAGSVSALGVNPRFELHNRSRRSVAIDARSPEGRGLAQRLVGSADVFVTNLRPSALSRLGLDPGTLCAAFPRLVYAQISGYGVGTPAADDASYDHGAFWAYSGLASTFADNGVPHQPVGGAGDRVAGGLLAGAVSAALFARQRTGLGGFVSGSLLAAGIWLLGSDMSDVLATGTGHRRSDRRSPTIPTLNCFRAADGRWFWLQMMLPERHWAAFVAALDSPVLEEDPRFRDGDGARLAAARDALTEVLDEIFRSRPLVEWEERFRAGGIPFAPVRTVEEAASCAVAHESGAIRAADVDAGGPFVVGSPVVFDGLLGAAVRAAPLLGEHTDAVLGELGVAPEDLERLRAEGIVGARAGASTLDTLESNLTRNEP